MSAQSTGQRALLALLTIAKAIQRKPKGSKGGGQFAPKGGGSGGGPSGGTAAAGRALPKATSPAHETALASLVAPRPHPAASPRLNELSARFRETQKAKKANVTPETTRDYNKAAFALQQYRDSTRKENPQAYQDMRDAMKAR
jgi:hypothetical protein